MSEADCKITISGVAKEAGVSNATIHNRYPDLASEIRELVRKAMENDSTKVRKKKKGKVKTPKEHIQELRNKLTAIQEKLAKAHTVNFTLDQENQSLKVENEALKTKITGNKRRINRL